MLTIHRAPLLGILAILTWAWPADGEAARPQPWIHDSGGLELADGTAVATVRQLRSELPPDARIRRATANLRGEFGFAWIGWDEATQIARRIVVPGTLVPGSIASPATAASAARNVLDRYLDLVAPGASPSDFVLVANDLDAGIRSVGFAQHHAGRNVVGATVSFRFKHDRLVAITSTAFPNVNVAPRASTVSVASGQQRAAEAMTARVPGKVRRSESDGSIVILPLVRGTSVDYVEVLPTEVELESPPNRFTVYLDASTGDPVAHISTYAFADATVQFNTPLRGPESGPRVNLPAPELYVDNGATQLETNTTGVVTFPGASATLTTNVAGPLVSVSNASGTEASQAFDVTDGSTIVWDERDNEVRDAQLSGFVQASLVKAYVRNIAPDLGWLNSQIPVTVNLDDQCNAFSDGNSINFFLSSSSCENTALLSDVVFHEFGHSVHIQSIIPGVGNFNGALSEGISDYLSATMHDDSGIGRGFFYDESPLRELDPIGSEWHWPEDRGQVHDEGRIIGGALWDLRSNLIAKLGYAEGVALTDVIWYQSIRRAVDIPSMYLEALVVDDDDGNLANGTPNACEINEAFGRHGLFSPGKGAELVTIEPDGAGHQVILSLDLPTFSECPIDANPTMEWKVRGSGTPSQTVPMTLADGLYTAPIPGVEDDQVVQYRVDLGYTNGTDRSLPDNYADEFYEEYVGDVVPLYCLTDEGPSGWTFQGPGWSQAPTAGAVDPSEPYDPANVWFGQAGNYPPGSSSGAISPVIDTGDFERVRLQYWRWLTVEDGFYDRARIAANGADVWSNHASNQDLLATIHHTDKEWRFHDIDISDQVAGGEVDVSFRLTSDAGLEFGGWTIDGLCIVGVGAAAPVCGDGVVDPNEECDDGNTADDDGCSATCLIEDGSTSLSTGSTSSTSGGDGDSDTDTDTDGAGLDDDLAGRGCGCTSTPSERPPLGWAVVLLGVLGLRSRQRRSRG